MKILHSKSPVDIANHVAERLNGQHRTEDAEFDLAEDRKWANEALTNPNALEVFHNQFDPQVVGEALETRAWEIRETYEEDREPLWFLDMFRDRGLIAEIQPGQRGDLIGIDRSYGGEIRYISDKTDDWPTSGGSDREYDVNHYKYYAGSVEVGILEQMQAAREGRDLMSERMRMKLRDIDEFNDSAIAIGSPLHGIYGFALHPNIPTQVFPVGAGAATQWNTKIPQEIRFDIQLAMEAVRTGSLYNVTPDIFMMADSSYTYISTIQTSPEGRTFLSQLADDFDALPWADPNLITPFLPFDTAGAGDTPIAMSGVLNRETVEFPMMPTMQLSPEYHGAKFKIGMMGAHGSVRIKRENRFHRFTGM